MFDVEIRVRTRILLFTSYYIMKYNLFGQDIYW